MVLPILLQTSQNRTRLSTMLVNDRQAGVKGPRNLFLEHRHLERNIIEDVKKLMAYAPGNYADVA
jgi:hypothetical protein